MTTPHWQRAWPVFLAIMLALAGRAGAMEIYETRWGFNRAPIPGVVNILSVLVSNSTDRPFHGELKLSKRSGTQGGADSDFVQKLDLDVHARRWIQFFPFVTNDDVYLGGSHWFLAWGGSAPKRVEFPNNVGIFSTPIFLIGTDDSKPSRAGFDSFLDELFPPSVAATDGLTAVALDHVPNWSSAQQEAFLDWLRRGGTAHLYPGPDGKYPVFTAGLALLEGSAVETRIGAGKVVRLSGSGDLADEAFLKERFVDLSEDSQSHRNADLAKTLTLLVHPEIHWMGICLLALAYAFVVGPVQYHWARDKNPGKIAMTLGATIAVFSILFSFVGRESGGRGPELCSVAWARSLGGGRWDVTQWSSASVGRSGHLEIQHQGGRNLYEAARALDRPAPRITAEDGGSLDLQLPSFAKQTFTVRAVLSGPDVAVRVIDWESDSTLKRLVLGTGPGFPKDALEVWAHAGKIFYQLTMVGDQLRLGTHAEEQHDLFPDSAHLFVEESDPPTALRKLVRPLMGWVVYAEGGKHDDNAKSAHPVDRLELFIFAPSPKSFQPRGHDFTKTLGRVLYEETVFKPAPAS